MAKTFPVVLINGILESGKTKFIIDSLKNGDFGNGRGNDKTREGRVGIFG